MNSQNNKNKSFIKKYLLSPYFLPNNSDDDFYFKEYKDENIILKEIQIYRNKNNIKESLAPCISILYRNLKLFNYNSDKFKKDKVYIICNDESNKLDLCLTCNEAAGYKKLNYTLVLSQFLNCIKPDDPKFINYY